MQRKKKKEKKIDRTPAKVAKDFWSGLYQKLQDRLIQSIEDGKETFPGEKNHYRSFIEKKRSLPDDKPVGDSQELVLSHHFLVKPYLPWNNLKHIQDDLKIDDKKFQVLLFILKPTPIEQTLVPEENWLLKRIDEVSDNFVTECNRKIKALSPLVKKLENLIKEDESYAAFPPIYSTISAMQYDIGCTREIVKRRLTTEKNYLDINLIDKDLKKSPQKHKYWNVTVSNALKILNPYCHTDNCENNCRKTHQRALTKIAELLKILYPSIWKEDIKTIASRIKQKDYRNLSA